MIERMNTGPGAVISSELQFASRRGRTVLVATVAASAIGQLDTTIANVALPHIGADFGVDVAALQWVLTGYLVTLASLILLGGALGDRYGRRKVFLFGTFSFTLASLLCAVAPGVEFLVAARVLQGAGAALLTPGSLAILQASFAPEDRARTVGAWSAFGGLAGAAGPFIGGWLVDGPGWRWAFLINLPVAVVVVVCSKAIPESRDEHAGRLDVRGAVIAVITLAATTLTLTEARPRGWTDPLIVATGVVGLGGIVAFVRHVRHARSPLVPPALFSSREFVVTNLATFTLYAAIGLTFFLVSYQLQVAARWSALQAGSALLPATVLMLLLAARSGALAQRIGPRTQVTLGPLILAAGLVLLRRVGTDPSWMRDLLPGAALLGCGLVTFVAPLTATVMGAVEPDHVSVASGVNNAVARTASLTALAVIPVFAGLTTASGPDEVTSAYRAALGIAALCAASASPIAFIGLGPRRRLRQSARSVYCPIDGPPVQPDPRRCVPVGEQVR
jgi:EmrB/QacA subfamily drug resistance transporter